MPAEQRAAIAAGVRAYRTGRRWPHEVRARIAAGVRRAYERDPSYRERTGAISRERWRDPEYRARAVATQRETLGTDRMRAWRSVVMERVWRDPAYRARRRQAVAERDRRIVAAWRPGMTHGQVAAIAGVSADIVGNALRAAGIDSRAARRRGGPCPEDS